MHATISTRRRTAVAAVALAVIGALSGCGHGRAAGRVAAQVGSASISSDAVVSAVDRGLAGAATLNRATLAQEHLTTLVRVELVKAVAKDRNITITPADIATTWAEFDKNNGDRAGLEKAAAAAGVAKIDLPAAVEMATYLRVLSDKLGAEGPVTDAELEKFRLANAQQLADRAHAAHILVKDEALANKLLADIKGGADFAALAKANSIDPSNKDTGGDLGVAPRGKYVPEFEKALWAAKKGDIVGPVKTEFGFHIIKVIEIQRFEDIKEDVRKAAIKSVGGVRVFDAVKTGHPVTINPRFGRWDPENLKVVPAVGADDPSAPKSPVKPKGFGGAPPAGAPPADAPPADAPPADAPPADAPPADAPPAESPSQ